MNKIKTIKMITLLKMKNWVDKCHQEKITTSYINLDVQYVLTSFLQPF